MAAFVHTLLLSVTVVSLPEMAFGAAFLGNRGGISDLLHELETVVGRDHRVATENRVERLEGALKPMFLAMPKDVQGRINAASVRYLLHRLFVQRHGWSVMGLDNNGESWNSSSPAAVFQNHAEEHHAVFDERLNQRGFALHEVAVFAAALETLVHGESSERLETAYRVLGLSQSEILSEEDAAQAIRAYMLIYNHKPQSIELSALTRRQFDFMDRRAGSLYSHWSETQEFARGIRQRILEDVAIDAQTTWETNLRIVEEIGERHGRWQDKDCHVLKNMLMDLEMPGTGRVRLEDFYRNRIGNESWNFVESTPYLRTLGALDETDPSQPSVIITNYLYSPTNCVSSGKFYEVCCIDQCEQLLNSLEQKVLAPVASPAQIIELMSALPSDTVWAPRVLASSLIQRLEEIATLHDGSVPLHGRLFAQWMHHAYPHECPFPHKSGTTKPQGPEKWLTSSTGVGQSLQVGEDEIRKLLEESTLADRVDETEPQHIMPWHTEEELFVSSPALPKAVSAAELLFVRGPVAMAMLSCAALLLRKIFTSGKSKASAGYSSNHKYYV